MSFLNDTRNFGILAMVAAAASMIGAAMSIAISGDMYNIISSIGSILGGILLFVTGMAIARYRMPAFMERVFPEGAHSKFGVLVGYTTAIGIASILKLDEGILWGAIILSVVWVITSDRKGVIHKILWVILAVVYFLGTVIEIGVACGGGFTSIVCGICLSIMYLLAFLYLFDQDVKNKFGI